MTFEDITLVVLTMLVGYLFGKIVEVTHNFIMGRNEQSQLAKDKSELEVKE